PNAAPRIGAAAGPGPNATRRGAERDCRMEGETPNPAGGRPALCLGLRLGEEGAGWLKGARSWPKSLETGPRPVTQTAINPWRDLAAIWRRLWITCAPRGWRRRPKKRAGRRRKDWSTPTYTETAASAS